MKNIDYNDILKYAKKLKEAYPEISNEDLKKALEAFFIGGRDIFHFSNIGIVKLPLFDTIAILSIVYNSLKKIITQDKKNLSKIQDDINRAIEFLRTI